MCGIPLRVHGPEVSMTRNMMLRAHLFLLLMLGTLATAGCEVVEGIFKAGVWVGILFVLVIAGILFLLFGRSRT
jgi:hypothetical protein